MAGSSIINNVSSNLLAKAWTPQLIQLTDTEAASNTALIIKAIERTLPLLEDGPETVPFVSRYRTEIIHPLTPRQVHLLQSLLAQHASLSSLRSKVLQVLPYDDPPTEVLTTVSKSELEDWYAPYKPPPKGSILQRIQEEHPHLVRAVEDLWQQKTMNIPLQPREELVHLVASKIAAEPKIASVVTEELSKHCRIHTTLTKPPKEESKKRKLDTSQGEKYNHYNDYRDHLMHLKDHQVLAIRRGMQQKLLSLSYEIDGTKMESCILYHLRTQELVPPILLKKHRELLNEAIHDAWTRLLRRRGTARLWTAKCQQAQERAYQVFQDNLERALLAPPFQQQGSFAPFLLALDPGFQAGIKCAILDFNGEPQRLDTVQFLGNRRDAAVDKLVELLKFSADGKTQTSTVVVALGNGHGSQDCRNLLQEAAAAAASSNILVSIHMVNEAGASVWSVTEAAQREFPKETPVSIASISIGRRLLNPLFELVKVPPRSLGLGMYQHDLNDKELEQRLHLGSVDAVATVGVDVNSCSLEILEKVPGLTKLAPKIMAARPLKQRADLLKVPGLGPQTFQNCAAFCRVSNQDSVEPLDATLVHPESYDLARWLLKRLSWRLDKPTEKIPPRDEWKRVWSTEMQDASVKFQVTRERVVAVLDNLVDSIHKVDPRTKTMDDGLNASEATTKGCSNLPSECADPKVLAAAVPLRGILGTIRNISDFGAFVDFGGHNDGLLHKSKLGSGLKLEELLIGQSIGVDILDVNREKVSLGVHGMLSEMGPASRRNMQKPSSKTITSRKRKR